MRTNPCRILALSVMGLACAASAVACGTDTRDGRTAGNPEATTPTSSALAGSFELPFGLIQPPGTVAIGRPAVFEHDLYEFKGVPVRAHSIRAAYRVTGADPVGVVRTWVDQLDGLALGQLSVRAAAESGSGPIERQPWIQVEGMTEYTGGPASDYVDLQLWVTGGDPILFVSIDRAGDLPPRDPTMVLDNAGHPPPPRSVVNDRDRIAGDELFEEQGDVMPLPAGTWSLMPTLPTRIGTGGSTSVIAAEEADAAVRALLDEAKGLDSLGDVTEPVVTETNGIRVVEAGFVITAGGWSFDVVAVRAPQDPYATVYVTSSAD